MHHRRKEVKLPIAAFVAARDAERDRSAGADAAGWHAADTTPFYRPLDRPLTLGPACDGASAARALRPPSPLTQVVPGSI
jgi:hypothetical protein